MPCVECHQATSILWELEHRRDRGGGWGGTDKSDSCAPTPPPVTRRFQLVEEARADAEKAIERRRMLKVAGGAAAVAALLAVVAVGAVKRWHGRLEEKGIVKAVKK